MVVKNILRYPGSKRRQVVYFDRILKENELTPDILVEPFVGGGSMFLYFLSQNRIKRAIIADKDRLIYSFWSTIFTNPNHLLNFIKKTKLDLSNFYKYKKIASVSHNFSKKELAETCLFLNRTSFSGILRKEVGPIGGRKQKSKYKIGCRFNKNIVTQRIKSLSHFRKNVVVLPYSWEHTISYIKERFGHLQREKILFYFDPPFFNKAHRLYNHYFSYCDHEKLCSTLSKLKYPWLLSYDNVPKIKAMYSKFQKVHIRAPYSINSPAKRIEKELIITSLKLPKIK